MSFSFMTAHFNKMVIKMVTNEYSFFASDLFIYFMHVAFCSFSGVWAGPTFSIVLSVFSLFPPSLIPSSAFCSWRGRRNVLGSWFQCEMDDQAEGQQADLMGEGCEELAEKR